MSTLTHHKKSVRAMVAHPTEFAFASASAKNVKKFALPEGTFLHNMLQQQRAIVNTMAVNEDVTATPESAPGLPFRPPKDIRRYVVW